MKIAITATGPDMDSPVDNRFGRCSYFVIVDTDTMANEAIENKSAEAMGGAGVQSSQLVINQGVAAVVTGNCGPNAFSILNAANIKVYTGASGKVSDAVRAFKSDSLKVADGPNSTPGFGRRG